MRANTFPTTTELSIDLVLAAFDLIHNDCLGARVKHVGKKSFRCRRT